MLFPESKTNKTHDSEKCFDALQLLHSSDIGGLDVVLILLNLLLEIIDGDLGILNNNVDLELLDSEANSNEAGPTPGKTVHLDGEDIGLHLLKIGLIIPRLNIKSDDRFGNCNLLEKLFLAIIQDAV